MNKMDFSTVVEDTQGNRYCFYYSGTSICCFEAPLRGNTRDIVIINQANKDFLVTIDEDDIIYLVCSSRDKGMLIFTYANNSWKYEQILGVYGSSLYLMNVFVIDKAIHILYAKRLPIAKFYNVFHLHNSNKGSWVKNNISEIFAESIEQAYSTLMDENGDIHFSNIWFDGTNYLINYNRYDNALNKWKTMNVSKLNNNKITIRLLSEGESLHLLCHTMEEDISIIFYFTKGKHRDGEFEFVSMDKVKLKCESHPVFYSENGNLYAAWLDDSRYNALVLKLDPPEGESQKWNKHVEAAVKNIDDIYLLKYIKKAGEKNTAIQEALYLLDDEYNITKPYSALSYSERTMPASPAADTKKDELEQKDINQYIPYLMEEIKTLSEIIILLNEKLNRLEGSMKSSVKEQKNKKTVESGGSNDGTQFQLPKNKSNFKERFMSSNPNTLKTESTLVFAGARNSTSTGFTPWGDVPPNENIASASNTVKPNLKEAPLSNEQNALATPPTIEKEDVLEPEQPTKPDSAAPTSEVSDISELSDEMALTEQSGGSIFKRLGGFFK